MGWCLIEWECLCHHIGHTCDQSRATQQRDSGSAVFGNQDIASIEHQWICTEVTVAPETPFFSAAEIRTGLEQPETKTHSSPSEISFPKHQKCEDSSTADQHQATRITTNAELFFFFRGAPGRPPPRIRCSRRFISRAGTRRGSLCAAASAMH